MLLDFIDNYRAIIQNWQIEEYDSVDPHLRFKARSTLGGIQSCWLVTPVTQSITVFSGMDTVTTFGEKVITDEKLNINLSHNKVFPS